MNFFFYLIFFFRTVSWVPITIRFDYMKKYYIVELKWNFMEFLSFYWIMFVPFSTQKGLPGIIFISFEFFENNIYL